MFWYFLGGFALCYAISCIIFGLYDSERFDWLGERFAWFFYLWAIPFAPVLLLYGFVIKPFWMFFRHVLWPPQWQKNGKPWIKVLNNRFAIYYNGKEVKKRYAYCLTFVK